MDNIPKLIQWLFAGSGIIFFSLFIAIIKMTKDNIKLSTGISLLRSYALAKKLAKHLKKTDYLGKGKPDLVVGVSSGGLMFADYISKYLCPEISVISLYADIVNNPKAPFTTDRNKTNKYMISVLKKFDKILIIQDIVRTGRTLEDLYKYFEDNIPGKQISVVTLIISNRALPKPDYFVKEVYNINFNMPFSFKIKH